MGNNNLKKCSRLLPSQPSLFLPPLLNSSLSQLTSHSSTLLSTCSIASSLRMFMELILLDVVETGPSLEDQSTQTQSKKDKMPLCQLPEHGVNLKLLETSPLPLHGMESTSKLRLILLTMDKLLVETGNTTSLMPFQA